jgi:hypothetical protein
VPGVERLCWGGLEMFRVREIKEAGWWTFSEVYLMPRRQLYVQRPNGRLMTVRPANITRYDPRSTAGAWWLMRHDVAGNSKYVYTSRLFAPFMVDGLGNKGLVLFVIVGPARRLRAGGAP